MEVWTQEIQDGKQQTHFFFIVDSQKQKKGECRLKPWSARSTPSLRSLRGCENRCSLFHSAATADQVEKMRHCFQALIGLTAAKSKKQIVTPN